MLLTCPACSAGTGWLIDRARSGAVAGAQLDDSVALECAITISAFNVPKSVSRPLAIVTRMPLTVAVLPDTACSLRVTVTPSALMRVFGAGDASSATPSAPSSDRPAPVRLVEPEATTLPPLHTAEACEATTPAVRLMRPATDTVTLSTVALDCETSLASVALVLTLSTPVDTRVGRPDSVTLAEAAVAGLL